MPVIPNLLERLVLFRLNRGPGAMLDVFGAAAFESATLARRLGVFEALAADGPLDAHALADRVDADPEGIERLCDFLVAERYLSRGGRGYALTKMTERWLLPAGDDMGPYLAFWDELVLPYWEAELETAVRQGSPGRTIYEWFDDEPGRWETAQEGFRSAAALLAGEVASAVTVPAGAERVIDVGGGHGLYSFELLRAHPELSATVFDLPGAIDAIEVPAELEGRVATERGDYHADDLGEGYDLALLFNVVHAQDAAGNTALFERVRESLAPGGRIVVLDQWAGSARGPVGKAYLRFIALTYLTTLDADIYPYESVKRWLEDAGFEGVRKTGVGPLSGQALVEAERPA